MMQTINGTEKF